MSRVKQPLEDAKEFASSIQAVTAATTSVADDDVARGGSDNVGIHITAAGDATPRDPNAAPATATTTTTQQPADDASSANSNDPNGGVSGAAAAAAGDSQPPSKVPSLALTPKHGTESTFIVDSQGNPIAYHSEQETLNLRLREFVLAVEGDNIKLAEQFLKDFAQMKRDMDALNPRRTAAIHEYTKVFAWPQLPDVNPELLVKESNLEAELQSVKQRAKELQSSIDHYRHAPALLDELTRPVHLLKRKNEIQTGLAPTSRLLLNDDGITEDVVIHLHDIAQGDVFAFTRAELSQKQRELDALREDLANTATAKSDALMTGDVRTAETYAFREIDISENIIERLRQRVQIIFQCDTDVREYCDKYQKTHELADQSLTSHEMKVKEWNAAVAKDIVRLNKAREEMTQRDADDEEGHTKKVEESNVSIRSVHQQQLSNWEKIMELLEMNRLLATQRERLVTDQVALHAAEVRRRAMVDAWFAGSQTYLAQLEDAQSSATTSLQWIAQLRTYVNQLCTQVESKRIDEEAWQLRVQEQLDYLEAYKQFKTLVDDITHRKELRVMSLKRVMRNLELQIKEAVETLDPNSKKYEREVATASTEVQQIEEQLGALKIRSKDQQTQWKLVEESLEEAQVDFTPPDIAAEKELCEKKTQALHVARQFVVAEQETVDKDTMRLRKLKTSNQVAIEGLNKRRADRTASSVEDLSAMSV